MSEKKVRTRKGRVVSCKENKTVRVVIERQFKDKLIGKSVRLQKVYPAHTDMDVKVGDSVLLIEVPPISKTKTLKVLKVID